MKRRAAVVGLLGVALNTGCSGDAFEPRPPEDIALRRTRSCADLGDALKADARAKLDARTAAALAFARDPSSRPVFATDPSADGASDSTDPGNLTDGGNKPAPGQANPGTGPGGGGSGATGKPPAHSTTTTQVAGVDEADIVKTDGHYLYALHGGSLAVVTAWPAGAMSLAASVPIEGSPIEMYLASGVAVVFSAVDPDPVLTAANLKPRPPVTDAYVAGPAARPAAYGAPAGPMTKITVLSLSGPGATVAAEHWIEGSYVSSRRVGVSIRAVINGSAHGPALDEGPAPSTEGEITAASLASKKKIDEASADDFLPLAARRRPGGAIEAALPSCDEFYVPEAGKSEYGIVRVVQLDTSAPDETRTLTVVGRADTVYGDRDTLWIAARPYLDRDAITAASLAGKKTEPVSLDATTLHAFDFSDPKAPRYVASGTLEGRVPDQFAMDEKDGSLRVATTGKRVVTASVLAPAGSQPQVTPEPLSHLVVLSPDKTTLRVTGTAGDVAPGEQIRATRFVGDHAFLVTARAANPLVAIDVRDPTLPTVVGAIDIPGFSEFVQPMDDTHLLTIGRDTSPGAASLSLSIFDIHDPSAPQQTQHFVYAGIDGYSTAETDHKAFTYWADRGLLAFPYLGTGPDGSLKSTLEVFRVSADGGFEKRGSIDHGPLFSSHDGFCAGAYGVDVRRGAFIEDVVYSISYGGIVASPVASPGSPLATVALPPPAGPSWLCP